jgi:hypothetical protein
MSAGPYGSESKMVKLLGFEDADAFHDWRASVCVQPLWNTFTSRCLDSGAKKVAGYHVESLEDIREWRREGER